MKPFTLQNVLDYRKRLEDIAQNRLFEARKIHHQIQLRLTEEKQILFQLSSLSEQMQVEGVAITDLIRFEERILQLKANVRAIEKNLKEKAEIVQREHQNLVDRAKDRQIMERLKEQQNAAWSAYLNKKETAMLDEIAILHHDFEK